MINKKTFRIGHGYLWVLAIVIGLGLFALVFVTSVNNDMKTTSDHLSDTVNYVKKQCATYSSLNLASEMKSLLRVIECAQQIDRNLTEDGIVEENSLPQQELLKQYVQELYLSGILILDENGQEIAGYSNTQLGRPEIKAELDKNSILNVMNNPQKTYAARISCSDGSYADMAACGRADAPGVIIAYYHTSAEYVMSYSLSFQSMLSGYSIENEGTIVVTDGERILASNDDSLTGKESGDIYVLSAINQKARNGQLVHVRMEEDRPGQSFGIIERGRDYYVYAFVSEKNVFGSTPRNLLWIAMAYLLIFALLSMIRWHMDRQFQEEQRAREQDYQKDLEEAARKAESANIAKTEFLQRMSHDIRTPINGIRGMIEIGNYYSSDLNKQAECRKKIWDASGLLLELINEVLDMGKMESGEVVLEERPFQVVDLVQEIVDVLEKQAAERGVTITCEDFSVQHPYLIGSPLHVKRLLMNIVSNAIKYNKDSGSIRLTCREVSFEDGKAWIEFICADTGIGMSEEFQQHLFEPFTQENTDARSTYGGTGLGMAITKSLVDKMGGSITFESKLNIGTTYFIVIPFPVDEEKREEQIVEAPAELFSLRGRKVLLAEDNELNMEIAEFLLENAGIVVTKAYNGKEALERFEQSEIDEFDAVLMDVMMPVMDGYEATKAIRALNRKDAKKIPILAMTANAFAEDRRKALIAGMNEHLTKPLESEKVLRALAACCAKRSHE